MTGWVVFGDGGHSRSVVDVLTRLGHDVVAVVAPDLPDSLDDEAGAALAVEGGHPVVVAVGAVGVRRRLVAGLAAAGARVPPLVAATATVAADAVLGDGTVVLEHAHVGPGAVLGVAVIVNTAAVVEHDCVLGDGVHVAPRATLAGHVRCGVGAMVGAGAVAIPSTELGEGATLGAGSLLLDRVPAGRTAVGVPCRLLDVAAST